jgi:subtilase family serine protease
MMPDLAVGLIRVRDDTQRSTEQGAGIPPHVVEVMVTISNLGESLADETTTRFWVRGPDMDQELRIVATPAVPPGEEVEVTATWDARHRRGNYVITVTADAFSQIEEVRTDNNSASVHVTVRDAHVDIVESPD